MSLAVNNLCFLSTQKVINDTVPTLSVTELSLCKSFKMPSPGSTNTLSHSISIRLLRVEQGQCHVCGSAHPRSHNSLLINHDVLVVPFIARLDSTLQLMGHTQVVHSGIFSRWCMPVAGCGWAGAGAGGRVRGPAGQRTAEERAGRCRSEPTGEWPLWHTLLSPVQLTGRLDEDVGDCLVGASVPAHVTSQSVQANVSCLYIFWGQLPVLNHLLQNNL